MISIYDVIKDALVQRGWVIDDSQSNDSLVESRGGEVKEFVHPITRKRMAWLDAIIAQGELELYIDKILSKDLC